MAETWPEEAVARVEGGLGYHVRVAMRTHTVAVLTEMRGELGGRRSTAPFVALLDAKIAQMNKLNVIDQLQHQARGST